MLLEIIVAMRRRFSLDSGDGHFLPVLLELCSKSQVSCRIRRETSVVLPTPVGPRMKNNEAPAGSRIARRTCSCMAFSLG